MDAVRHLNKRGESFEVRGDGADADPELDGVQWLPSTLSVALQLLRKQDPVTVWEDNPVSFAALFNFVRNFSPRFPAHVELVFREGFKSLEMVFCKKKTISKAHGRLKGQRGCVLIDPDYTRGSEALRCEQAITTL